MRYHRYLMNAILSDKVRITLAVNVRQISLDDAPKGNVDLDKGAAKTFIIDPHGSVA